MFKVHLRSALRRLVRRPGYSALNIVGLAVALACSLFVVLWSANELRYDRFHEDGESLFILRRHVALSDGQVATWTGTPVPLAALLEQEYPEVRHAEMVTFPGTVALAVGAEGHQARGHWAEGAFFEMFSFPLLVGDPATALRSPNGLVLTETFAARLFGKRWQDEGVVGRTVRVDGRADFQVAGVAEAPPATSTIQFDVVLPAADYYRENAWLVEDWSSSFMQLFVQLAPGTDYEAFNEKLAGALDAQFGTEEVAAPQPFLQPLADVHLHGRFEGGAQAGGRIESVWAFGLVAAFVLLIAAINFMNLATAQAAKRAKGVGVRKAIGAGRGSVSQQFLVESVLLALIAFALAALVVVLLLPAFSALTGTPFTLAHFDPAVLGVGLGIAVLTGVLAGSYPALYLSSFSPVTVLRGTFRQGPAASRLRKGLVVVQFGLSTLLIVGTLTVDRQMDYVRTKDLGLDRAHVVALPLSGEAQRRYDAFRQELLLSSGISAVTAASTSPVNVASSTSDVQWEGQGPDDYVLFDYVGTRHDFVEALGIELVAGRSFSRDFVADTANVLVNERAVEAMGLADPVGTSLSMWPDLPSWAQAGEIIGVVRDFHTGSLHESIEPTIIRLDAQRSGVALVRIEPARTEEALARLESVHARFSPGYPFAYSFLDTRYEQMYEAERVVESLARVLALVASLVACLGLFGLATFTAEQRRKEVGVRKVLGASVSSLLLLMTREFVALIALAFVLAAPVAWGMTGLWLDGFVYRVPFSTAPLLLSGALLVIVALAAVSAQALRAATADPVHALRAD